MEIKAMHRNGKSIRAIAKELGVHRSTVKKHLSEDEFPRYRKAERRESILAPYVQTIQDYLEENDYKATWVWDRLKNRGYAGGYDTVRRYVRTIKDRQSRLACARFETEPSRLYRVFRALYPGELYGRPHSGLQLFSGLTRRGPL